jgi:hypothetical protein
MADSPVFFLHYRGKQIFRKAVFSFLVIMYNYSVMLAGQSPGRKADPRTSGDGRVAGKVHFPGKAEKEATEWKASTR